MICGISFTLAPDRLTLNLRAPLGENIKMSAAEVSGLISALANFREQMAPPIPTEIPAGQHIHAQANPRWIIEPDETRPLSLFHIHNPGLGWLHFAIPFPEGSKLGEALRAHARLVRPPTRQ